MLNGEVISLVFPAYVVLTRRSIRAASFVVLVLICLLKSSVALASDVTGGAGGGSAIWNPVVAAAGSAYGGYTLSRDVYGWYNNRDGWATYTDHWDGAVGYGGFGGSADGVNGGATIDAEGRNISSNASIAADSSYPNPFWYIRNQY